jgi:hypothetical protein
VPPIEAPQSEGFAEDALTAALPGGVRAVPGLCTFTSKQVLSSRHKIIRFTGRGGMGEVYEAEDLELQERVALKTIRPEIASDERVIERFKREIQLARRVTHPNVCCAHLVALESGAAAKGYTLIARRAAAARE